MELSHSKRCFEQNCAGFALDCFAFHLLLSGVRRMGVLKLEKCVPARFSVAPLRKHFDGLDLAEARKRVFKMAVRRPPCELHHAHARALCRAWGRLTHERGRGPGPARGLGLTALRLAVRRSRGSRGWGRFGRHQRVQIPVQIDIIIHCAAERTKRRRRAHDVLMRVLAAFTISFRPFCFFF